MSSYFYDDDKKEIIKQSLLTDAALDWAKKFVSPKQPQDRRHKNQRLTSAQLRRFHFEVKSIEQRLKSESNPQEKFLVLRPIVKMLKSKVAYACRTESSKERKVPEEFRDYIDTMVDRVEDYKDFMAFALSFEAVVGFFYGQGGK